MRKRTLENEDGGTVNVCAMCERAAILESDAEHVLCGKKGIVAKDFVCSRFSFDPLKYVPGEKAGKPEMPDLAEEAETDVGEKAEKPDGGER